MSATPEATRGADSRCARCGAGFTCGMRAGAERCWCADLPPIAPMPGEDCLCADCLRAAIAAAARAADG